MIIEVGIKDNEYKIIIERGVMQEASKYINLNRKVLIVTDTGVPAQYAECVAKQCLDAKITVIEQGEASKNLVNYEKILVDMLEHNMSRSDCVVAVGGGVIGDMAGFAAACYMRGVDFYNIPTTVLSQVDSSVGGKTAIDFHGVKNVVGAFHQPGCVLIDPDSLKTLPKRQISNGLAEAVKMAATFDEDLFSFIENNDPWENIDEIIARAIDIKRKVVEEDEKEKGLRRVLNFGHTLGHGIEVAAKNQELYHGESVAIGMLLMCSDEVRARLIKVLKKLDLPTYYEIDLDAANKAVVHDKKAGAKSVKAVYVEKIGSFEMVDMGFDELEQRMEKAVEEK